MQPVSKFNPLSHYKWGDNCDGWVLVDTETLSVKQECMPPGTAEALHYHNHAQQFFYILKGTATFEVGGKSLSVLEGQGFHIEAGVTHRIINDAAEDLEFILSSQPSTNSDRHAPSASATPPPPKGGTDSSVSLIQQDLG